MKHKILTWSRRYQAALRTHLDADDRESLEAVRALGSEILAAGVPMLELAKLHEKFLVSKLLPDYPVGKRAALIERAGKFFAAAVVPSGTTLRPGSEDRSPLEQTVEMLSRRTVDLAASNLALSAEITRRKSVEHALKEKERGYARLLKESAVLHEQLRNLSRQILSAQEDERKEISRELHDMVAQTLTGINIHLAALQAGATLDGKSLARNISETQLLVEHSVDLVHRFARDLRPAVLDDLGLIPALQSFMKSFTEQTGVRTHLTAFAGGVIVVRGEDEHLCGGKLLENLAGGLQPVEPRHGDVHQHHVGTQFVRQRDGLPPVFGFTDHSQVGSRVRAACGFPRARWCDHPPAAQ